MSESAVKTLFLEELRAMKQLTPEETAALFEEGSEEAKKKIIEGNIYRVAEAAHYFESEHIPYMDLVQEGNLALTLFVYETESYGPETEEKLNTAIHEALRSFASQEDDSKRAGEELSARLNLLNDVCVKLAEELGREATAEEVAKKVSMDPDDVKYLMRIALAAVNKED